MELHKITDYKISVILCNSIVYEIYVIQSCIELHKKIVLQRCVLLIIESTHSDEEESYHTN